ncbi:hypothetical protein CRYUN_Cryun05aG0250700 [Craigia yunnanensis]
MTLLFYRLEVLFVSQRRILKYLRLHRMLMRRPIIYQQLLFFSLAEYGSRFRGELLRLRDLKLRAYMADYAPKEKNLILRLSLATLNFGCLFYI